MLMRLGHLEDAVEEQGRKIEQLGHRIEPTNSAYNLKKISSYNEFVELEESLKDEEFYKLTVFTLFFITTRVLKGVFWVTHFANKFSLFQFTSV